MTDPTAAERIVKQWWKEDCGHHVEADDFQSQCVEGCLIKYLTTALAEARREGKVEPEDLDCANPYCKQEHQTISVRVHRTPPKIDV